MSELTKEKLEEMYQRMTNKELARELGISHVTLIRYLEDAGVKMKGKGNKRKIRIV